MRRGIPVVVSAPSGTGKTTLCHRVIKTFGGAEFSVSYTTRAPRGHERNGSSYHFVSETHFDELIASGAMLEWAPVFAHRYGTGRDWVYERLNTGVDVLFDIDVQGGMQIKKALGEALLVFVLPPSMQELEHRLRGRGTDTEEQLQIRLGKARDEIARSKDYDVLIVNDTLDIAVHELGSLLVADRLKHVDRDALIAQVLGS